MVLVAAQGTGAKNGSGSRDPGSPLDTTA
jgi:hypothetical protein